MSLKNGRHLFEDLLMNLFSAAAIPMSFWTSFAVFGLMRLLIAMICLGLASIPRLVIKCPKNFPELTPKAHFAAFSLSLRLLSTANTTVKSLMWSNSYLLLTTISSMQASMVLLSIDLNIFMIIL